MRAERPRLGAAPSGGSKHILLVEDDVGVLDTTAAMLTSLGHTVRAVTGPSEALQILRGADEPIDLLLSDVMMPKMTGVQLAGEARRLQPGLKVLLISGYSQEGLSSPAKPDQGLPLLAKPYQQADLAAQLSALFETR
jgi:CheY-like chemotaxis protein